MKILFVSRASLFSNPGGDTIQVTQTAQWLQKVGVDVHIALTNEEIQYNNYELIHFFNIIRPADILRHSTKLAVPYVVSTIFVDYAEFERTNSSGLRRVLSGLLSADMMEYLKVVARSFRNSEQIGSVYYLLRGHRSAVKRVIFQAAMLLPNSQNEYRRLKKRYRIDVPYAVIPNGIDPTAFRNEAFRFQRNPRQVLCVARIEPLKNQLNLIKGLRNTDFRVLIIGKASANHEQYFQECKKAASKNIQFIDYMPQRELLKFYFESQVHLLPSWFETTGLSSLEAAACGCNIVISDKGDVREYFGDYAFYCDPASPESILNAVTLASSRPVNPALAEHVIENYTWSIAANRTLDAYNQVILRTKS